MKGSQISDIKAREIVDDRGMPTVQVTVFAESGEYGIGSVPCGSSVGKSEATELRDGEARYQGRGVRKAVANVNEVIAPKLRGMDPRKQREIDLTMLELDSTPDKSRLGANAILGVSLAVSRVAAQLCRLPLYRYINANAHVIPVPQACIIDGGLHAGNDLAFQEICVMPVGAGTFAEATRIVTEVCLTTRELLIKKYGISAVNIGDDRGFAAPISTAREAMDILSEAVEQAGHTKSVAYGFDVASTHFYDEKTKKYTLEGTQMSRDEMINYFKELLKEYPSIISLEDPLYEDDFEGTATITKELGIRIIGDDLFTTNIERLKKGIALGSGNAVLWKVNQIGTLTEALDTAMHGMQEKYAIVPSGRSGETGDDIIPDICVALNAPVIKCGSTRVCAWYNRVMKIEEELGKAARYSGRDFILKK